MTETSKTRERKQGIYHYDCKGCGACDSYNEHLYRNVDECDGDGLICQPDGRYCPDCDDVDEDDYEDETE